MWEPKLGDTVWFNYPDSPKPLGTVVGFVSEDDEQMPERAGQPIIKREKDEPPNPISSGKKAGELSVLHPMFLLPFKYGGEEWKKAAKEGRIKDPSTNGY